MLALKRGRPDGGDFRVCGGLTAAMPLVAYAQQVAVAQGLTVKSRVIVSVSPS
jgi:hypothetical protein